MEMEVTSRSALHPPVSRDAVCSQSKSLRPLLPWIVAGFAGLLLTSASLLWRMWTADALRSIGICFPILSVVLLLRVWRGLHWESRGTWWGIVPLYYAAIMAREGGNALQLIAFTHHMGIALLPLGLTIFAYGSGVVLLLGGTRVWRKSLFPLTLLLLVNPVPTSFQRLDLPLQFFCARIAQSFASFIGVHPDVNQLHLMFAPAFGMFIAPGCNGIRGAVTMGYLALILGYLYRFSVRNWILSVLGAVALGYAFNLVRLCFLVLFYRIALSLPWLQPHGTGADYLIGGILFLVAATLFAGVLRWGKKTPEPEIDEREKLDSFPSAHENGLKWKGAVVAVLAAMSCISSLVTFGNLPKDNSTANGSLPKALFPQQMGKYRLLRSWSEQDWLNQLAYRWTAYSSGKPGHEVDVALWLGRGVHYPIACHISRGQRPTWNSVIVLPTAQGASAMFSVSFYEGPRGATLEATTVCDTGGCNEHVLLPSQVNVAFASMGIGSLLIRPDSRPLPMLIRQQSQDPTELPDEARKRMLTELKDFISQLNTPAFVHFAESRGL